jgi:hypothetical protein
MLRVVLHFSLYLICLSCVGLKRSYGQTISSMSSAELMRWQCPACLKTCTCAACLRKNSNKNLLYNSKNHNQIAAEGHVNASNSPPSKSNVVHSNEGGSNTKHTNVVHTNVVLSNAPAPSAASLVPTALPTAAAAGNTPSGYYYPAGFPPHYNPYFYHAMAAAAAGRYGNNPNNPTIPPLFYPPFPSALPPVPPSSTGPQLYPSNAAATTANITAKIEGDMANNINNSTSNDNSTPSANIVSINNNTGMIFTGAPAENNVNSTVLNS